MDEVLHSIARLFTETPWILLSWPACAMFLGTLVAVTSKQNAIQLAVVPRTANGLIGLLTAPFIHANFAHLAANLPVFLVLGALVLRRGETRFISVALTITFGQGVLIWLFARRSAHVGMSGVIFGFFGWLLAVAYFVRSTSDLLVAIVVIILYGGMIAGIAPVRKEVSWEGHLFGLLIGIGFAWFQYGH